VFTFNNPYLEYRGPDNSRTHVLRSFERTELRILTFLPAFCDILLQLDCNVGIFRKSAYDVMVTFIMIPWTSVVSLIRF
jgi:hypothetical protein